MLIDLNDLDGFINRWCQEAEQIAVAQGLLAIAERLEPRKVKIDVRGGVAYCDNPPDGVEVEIIDHDNDKRA